MPSVAVSVIVVVKNEATRIKNCLDALSDFTEVFVVDSTSTDNTCSVARQAGVQVVPFEWNGLYPKKRQWCLDNLNTRYDWVFFVDADEIITPALAGEMAALDFKCAGYFVRGRYVINGKMVRFGLGNNKLALINRRQMEFPVIDDLGLAGMGEIEGHYQPVLKAAYAGCRLGQLREPLLHYAYEGGEGWQERHERYAAWERGMNDRQAWPHDPVRWRQVLKTIFREMPCRPLAAFLHSYVFKLGILDGRAGLKLAADRYRYYRMVCRRRQ